MMEVKLPAIEAAATVTDASGNTVADADKAAYYVNAVGFALIQDLQVEIGGTEVDTLYPEWMFFWDEMTGRPGARLGEQIGKFEYSADVEDDMIEFASQARTLFVPLPLWFNKYFMEHGLSIPLIALTYHEIRVKVTFRPLSELCVVVYRDTDATHGEFWAQAEGKTPVNTATGSTLATADLEARLLVTYIYLDADER